MQQKYKKNAFFRKKFANKKMLESNISFHHFIEFLILHTFKRPVEFKVFKQDLAFRSH